MKNILVTGGAGFIGSHTVVELVSSGFNPVIIDNFSNSNKSVINRIQEILGISIKCYEASFEDKKTLLDILASEKIDGVIHFAAFKAVGESVSSPLKYYKNNVSGLVDFLQELNSHGIDSMVFSSSCTVYGEPDKLPIKEDANTKEASSPYGATKQMGERIISDVTKASDSLRSLSLRYFNPIGAHSSALIGELPIGVPANLVPLITQTVAGIREKLIVYGDDYPTEDGTCIRDYIHVVDLAKAHVKALEYLDKKAPKHYDVINIGTGEGTSVLEVIKTFEKVTGKKVPYEIGQRREGDIISTYAGVDKAKSTIGWEAEKNLSDALIDAWRWQETLRLGKD